MKTTILIVTALILSSAVSVVAQEEVIDQQQTDINYGFWFQTSLIRWQEFMPTLDNLSAIEIYIHKTGNPGNVIAEIRTVDDSLLGQELIAEADVHDYMWLKVDFSEAISLEPGSKYRIYISSDQASPNVDNRYYWEGSTNSTYTPECSCDVQIGGAWATYDYAFKTYGYLPVSVNDNPQEITPHISLSQNYPNPFNAFTTIHYELSNSDFVTLTVYDILGREVQTLVEKSHDAGAYVINFDAKDLCSGIYLYKLQTGNSLLQTKKMLLIR
jgi:hypothetical protein